MPKSAASSTSESSHGSSSIASSIHEVDLPGKKIGFSDDNNVTAEAETMLASSAISLFASYISFYPKLMLINPWDHDEDSWEHSHGFWDIIYGATYLAQTPHEQVLSVKKGLASSLIQSTQLLFLLLNPYAGLFAPDENLWVYKYFSWVLFKIPILQIKSYTVYIAAVYMLLGALLTVVSLIGWMSHAIKNDEHERRKYRKLLAAVRPAAGLLFLVFAAAIMDLCSGVFMCSWQNWPNPAPLLWPDKGSCMAGEHMVHAALAAVTFVLYWAVSTLMGVGTCEQNPASAHMSSSPNVQARLCISGVIKPLFVIFSNQLTFQPKWQAALCLLLTLCAFWINFRQMPYYRAQTNSLHCGLWLGCAYISALGIMGATCFEQGQDPEQVKLRLTWWAGVLVMPVGVTGIILGRLRPLSFKRDLARIAAAPVNSKPHKVIRLKGRWHVEVLSRCVRERRDNKTGQFDQDSLDLADTVLAYGAAKYGKDDPFMVTLQASFSIFVHNDIQQARMQLQSVSRDHGNILQAYGQFCCGEYIRAMKDSANAGMDLASFVEFSRNYRAAVRAHRQALQAQREFWCSLLKDRVQYADLENVLERVDAATKKATQVYRRVTERYPDNAKLLKVFARFVEEVLHDPWRANKLYSEAERQDSSDGNMKLSSMIKSMEANSSSAKAIDIDEQKDGIAIVNAAGIMMTTNPVFCALFGYARTEMEGRDLAMIIPHPYNQRHNGYIERYIATGEAHILDTTRRVIGLHKDKYMIPITLFVQHLSGTGSDMVFLGVVKPAVADSDVLEVWDAPHSGTVLCVDPRLPDYYGFTGTEVAGKPLSTLMQDGDALDTVVSQVSMAMSARMTATNRGSAGGSTARPVSIAAVMKHKYLDPLDVQVTVEPVGTPAMPWLIFKLERNTPPLPLAVMDHRLSIVSASSSFTSLLGYQQKQLVGMNMSDIIPAPWAQLHSTWVREMPAKAPPQSCRSGRVVSLLTKNNVQLPVKISVSSKDDAEGGRHVVQVLQRAHKQHNNDQQRLLLSVDRTSGCIVEAADGSQAVFGWEPSLLAGQPLTAVVDVFDMWETSNGAGSATMLLQSLSNSANINIGESWRVGVKPLKSGGNVNDQQQKTGNTHGWDKVLTNIHGERKSELLPARMQVVLDAEEGESWTSISRVSIALWRADALSGVVEVDQAMRVLKADTAVGIILGYGSSSIVKHSMHRYLSGLPMASDLLQSAPKGSMKKKGPTWLVGKAHSFSGTHRDGRPMSVSLQGVGREGAQSGRMILHVRAMKPATACIEVFTHMIDQQAATDLDDGTDTSHKTGKSAYPHTTPKTANRVSTGSIEEAASSQDDENASGQSGGDGEQQKQQQLQQQPGRQPMQGRLHVPPGAGRRGNGAGCAAGLAGQRGPPRQSSQVRMQAEWDGSGSDLEGVGSDSEDGKAQQLDDEHHEEPLLVGAAGRFGSSAVGRAQATMAQEPAWFGQGGLRQRLLRNASSDKFGGAPDSYDGYATAAISIMPKSSAGGIASKLLAAPGPVSGSFGTMEGDRCESKGSDIDVASSTGESSQAGAGGTDALSSLGNQSGSSDLHFDARRAKRLKKLQRMLQNDKAQRPRRRFKWHTWAVLAGLLAVHIGCFLLFDEEMAKQHRYIYEVEEMARATDQASLLAAQSFVLAKCLLPEYASTALMCEQANLRSRIFAGLQSSVSLMRRGHQGMYLGFDKLRVLHPSSLYSMWAAPVTTETMWYDTAAPKTAKTNTSLWNLGNNVVNCGAQLLADTAQYVTNGQTWPAVAESRHLRYIQDQAAGVVYDQYTLSLDRTVGRAYNSLGRMNAVLIILMVLEAFGITLALVVYNWVLVHNMARHHMIMFTAFLAMPSALIRSMAARPCVVDEEDADADEDDDEFTAALMENGRRSAAGQGSSTENAGGKQVRMAAPTGEGKSKMSAGKKASGQMMAAAGKQAGRERFFALLHRMTGTWGKDSRKSFKVSGKRLLPSIKMEMKSMFLFVVFQLLLVLIYSVSFSRLSGLEAPVSQLNTAQHIVYRASRTRVFAVNFVFSTTQEQRDKWRSNLVRSCGKLQEEYTVLLYGGILEWISTSTKSEFLKYSPPVVFNDRATADLFFASDGCLRKDKSTCFPPGDKYHEVTHNGINPMMMRYIEECRLLQADNDTDIYPNNSRYQYIYKVGGKDLYEATQMLAYSITQNTLRAYDAMKTLHLILLLLCIGLPFVYLICVFRPLLQLTHSHTSRVAGLLSQLPPEVDVESHLKAALNHNRRNTEQQQHHDEVSDEGEE